MPIELNDTFSDDESEQPTSRIKRHKPKRGLGSAVTRKRRLQAEALEADINRRREAAREAARREMARIKERNEEKKGHNDERWRAALLRNVVSLQTAVLRSMGHHQSVSCELIGVPNVNAWTDFRRIYVGWPQDNFPNRLNQRAVLDTVAQIKGVMQHEMGHVRFTTPYKTVLENVKLPKHYEEDKVKNNLLFQCWNMLEDMRMECLVVESNPRIGAYFGTMVANVVLGGDAAPAEQVWIMLAGRTYLPADVLKQSAEMFDAFCQAVGVKNGAREWERLVNRYKSASTHKQLLTATIDAYEFIQKVRAQMPPAMDMHDMQQRGESGNDPGQTSRSQGSILDMFDEQARQQKQGGKGQQGQGDPVYGGQVPGGNQSLAGKGDPSDKGEGEGQGGKDGEGQGKDGKGKGEGQDGEGDSNGGDPAKGVGNGDGNTETLTPEQDFKDSLESMAEHYRTEMRADADVQQMVREANLTSDRDGLPEYNGSSQEMSPELQSAALFTSIGITKALNSFVTTSAPIWQNRKEVGVIDPLAYRTKAPGDRDFRRHLDDHGNQGLDVHVSMLCDVSGSMSGTPMQALSESLYATALACEALGIGATYTLWSSGNQCYRIWTDTKPTPTLFPSMGGTDPTDALDDLDLHNPEGASKHLVIIFTDGAWASSFPSLTRWAAPDRTFVLVRYGAYDGAVQKDMGADQHIAISNVRDLPAELTKALIDVLGEKGW